MHVLKSIKDTVASFNACVAVSDAAFTWHLAESKLVVISVDESRTVHLRRSEKSTSDNNGRRQRHQMLKMDNILLNFLQLGVM